MVIKRLLLQSNVCLFRLFFTSHSGTLILALPDSGDKKLEAIIQNLPPTWITSFLEVQKQQMHCIILFLFCLTYLTNAQYVISSWSVMSQSTWRSPIIFSANEVNLHSRMLDKILYAVDVSDMPVQLLQDVSLHFLLIGNSSLFQIELISLWISERIALFPDLFSFVGIWIIPGDLWLFLPLQ